MMKITLALLLFIFCAAATARADCLDSAREVAPTLSAETRREFEARLAEARADFVKSPREADSHIWLERRAAYLGPYKAAVGTYTEARRQFQRDARLYRPRGHRLITLRCFDAAAADLERAAKLFRGAPDEVEPDGLPNARNTPTGTLQSNVWYHLGLAYYLKGDFRRALGAFREAEKVSKNPDMLVATTHWLYMTLRRLRRESEASEALARVADGLDVIENGDYYRLVKLYQGRLKESDIAGGAA